MASLYTVPGDESTLLLNDGGGLATSCCDCDCCGGPGGGGGSHWGPEEPEPPKQTYAFDKHTWLFENTSENPYCVLHYDTSPGNHSGGTVVRVDSEWGQFNTYRKPHEFYDGLYFDNRIAGDRLWIGTNMYFTSSGEFVTGIGHKTTGWMAPRLASGLDDNPANYVPLIRIGWRDMLYKKTRHSMDWELNHDQESSAPDGFYTNWLYAVCDVGGLTERTIYWQMGGTKPKHFDFGQLAKQLYSGGATDYQPWIHQQFGPFHDGWNDLAEMYAALDSIYSFDMMIYARQHDGVVRVRRQTEREDGVTPHGGEAIVGKGYVNTQVWVSIVNTTGS